MWRSHPSRSVGLETFSRRPGHRAAGAAVPRLRIPGDTTCNRLTSFLIAWISHRESSRFLADRYSIRTLLSVRRDSIPSTDCTDSSAATSERNRRVSLAMMLACASLILGSGCATTGAPPEGTAGQHTTVTVAVVSSDDWAFEWGTRNVAEEDLSACLAEKLSNTRGDLRVMVESEFLAAAFPDLSPEAAPRSPEYIKMALTHPKVRERVKAARVDYVLYVAGTREMRKSWQDTNFVCIGGVYGATCTAWVIFDHTSQLTASLIDVQSTAEINLARADASSTSWLVMPIAPLFLFYAPDTRAEACGMLAQEIIAKFKSANLGFTEPQKRPKTE